MDGCVNCKRCLTECPTGVDIPWVAMQARAHHVQKRGQSFKDRFISDTHLACRVGSTLAPLVNLAFSLGSSPGDDGIYPGIGPPEKAAALLPEDLSGSFPRSGEGEWEGGLFPELLCQLQRPGRRRPGNVGGLAAEWLGG